MQASSNDHNVAKMPEENSNTMPMLSDIDVTLLSEEEISALREVFERQWVLHEINAERKRQLEQEIKGLEESITGRSRGLTKKAISEFCNVCFKVKVASTAVLICANCRKKTCLRCGKRDQGLWRCALCLKKRAYFIFTVSWYNDEESRDRLQVQDMLNKLAEESIRRMEMPVGSIREEPTVRVSTPPNTQPNLQQLPATIHTQLHVPRKLPGKRDVGGDDDYDGDADDDDDEVFEGDNEGSDKYLSFPYQEEQSQGELFESSFTALLSSSVEEEVYPNESQGASAGGFLGNSFADVDQQLENQSPKRKVAVTSISKNNEGLCPMIQKVSLRKDPRFYGGFGSGTEFGMKVVGGRMCTGGFNGVYVAKVTRGSFAEQYIKEGDQILEWNHVSMVDVSFEQVRKIVADSPEDVTLVVCHNTASFEQRRRQNSRERAELAMHAERKRYESIKCWSRWSLAQLMADDSASEEVENKTTTERTRGQIQLHLWHDPNGNNMIVRVLGARGLSLKDMPNQELPNPYVLLYLLPNREISSQFKTNTDPQTVTPKWDLSFIFANIPEEELSLRTLEVTLWSEDHRKGHTFLGEVLIKLTPELMNSGAQCTWFNLEDHDDASPSFPVPMPRRHTLTGKQVLERKGLTSWCEDAKMRKYSESDRKLSSRSLSSVDVSRRDSQILSDSPGGNTLHHRKQRRADSVVRAEAFYPKPKPKPEISEGEIEAEGDLKEKVSGYKWSSAPCTPGTLSMQASAEDLRRKRSSSPALDSFLKRSAITLSEYLAQNRLPEAKPVDQEPEETTKEGKEGKMKGALKAMKKYPANLKIRLSRLSEKQTTLGEDEEHGACGPMTPFLMPGYNSAPVTPSRSASTENLVRERSLTNYDYLQVPPSPGFLSRLLTKRCSGYHSPEMTSPLVESPHESDVPPSPGVFARKSSRKNSPSHQSSEVARGAPMPEIKEKELYFSYPKTQLSNVAEQELAVDEDRLAGAVAQDRMINSEDHHRSRSFSFNKSALTETDQDQQPFIIPRIAIHPSSSPSDKEPDVKPKAEAEVEKKGAMGALRKYSKHLMPRFSLKVTDKKHSLHGEDPEKGVTGPGQIRRGSYQGHELGYIRIGLSVLREILEVEIIRAIGLLVLGDHLPATYVKTYLVKDQMRLLKRKTSITRQSANPVYNCKIKYPVRDLHNKELLVSVWCKQGFFGRKVLLGEVRIALASLDLSVKQVSWYKLFIEQQLSDGD